MKLKLHVGTRSKSARIWIQDCTVGFPLPPAGLTGLTHASSGLKWGYFRDGDTAAGTVSLVAGTLGTYVSGGFVEVDAANMPGMYEVGVPDVILSVAGSAQIQIWGAAKMCPILVEFELDAINYQDGRRLGMTALPNADCTNDASLITSGTRTDQLSVEDGAAKSDAVIRNVTIR